MESLAKKVTELEAKVATANPDVLDVSARPLVSFGACDAWDDAPAQFVHISSTRTQLLALGDDGLLYCCRGWSLGRGGPEGW